MFSRSSGLSKAIRPDTTALAISKGRRSMHCDKLQGLKPKESSGFVVAAKAATYKT
jgi:hypothetical protein